MFVWAPACGWTFACSAPKSAFARSIASLLDLVDDLAAAVVALARVALGVLVRRHDADGLEDARPREVLGRDQLDLVALALELLAEQLGDLGIDLGEAGGAQLLERVAARRPWCPGMVRRAAPARVEPLERLGGRTGALAQDPRLRAGEVDHRGRHARAARRRRRARRPLADLLRHVVEPPRVGPAVEVRARRGDRARRASSDRRAAPRQPGTRTPIVSGVDRSATGSAAPGSAARACSRPGSSARASTRRGRAARARARGAMSTSGASERDRLLRRRGPSAGTAARRRLASASCAEAVHRVGRQDDRLARPDRRDRLVDEALPRPSTTRSRPARSRVIVDVLVAEAAQQLGDGAGLAVGDLEHQPASADERLAPPRRSPRSRRGSTSAARGS